MQPRASRLPVALHRGDRSAEDARGLLERHAAKEPLLRDLALSRVEGGQFIERAIIFAEGGVLTGRDLAEVAPALPMVRAVPSNGLHQPLAIEEYIRAVVERFQDTRSEAELAKMLGIGRKALWARRRQWGLKRMRQRSS